MSALFSIDPSDRLFAATDEEDPVLLSWRNPTAAGDSTAPSLDVLESLLHLRDVRVQVGAVGKLRSAVLTGRRTSERTRAPISRSLPTRVWPSTSVPTPPLSTESIERALRLKAMAVGTEELLYKTLLDPRFYEPDVRPTYHHTVPTNITFGFLLNQLGREMDERNQKLTTRCWLNVNWLDHRLSWNASHWDGLKVLYIPFQKVWRPDIALINSAFAMHELLSTDIMVTHEGNVTWLFSAIYVSGCEISVQYYPFDQQEGDLSSYMNNSEFDLLEMKAARTVARFPTDNSSSWAMIEIRIKMKRRPLFYVFNHILPLVLISSMALLGFPSEFGKWSYLASALFMNIREPDSITLLKTSQSRLSTLRRKSLMRDLKKSKNLDHRKTAGSDHNCECLNSTPRLRRTRTDDLEARLLPAENNSNSTGETAFLGKLMKEQLLPRMQQSGNLKSDPMMAEFEERFKRILKRIYRSLQQNEIREEICDERRRIAWQWASLANVLDRFLLFLFLGATLATVSAFMLPPSDTFAD
ncbi:hypothetical protein M3Y99_00084800 [Aphelenchoides fujianensis]|nr:hypothetical protein M3Y99_00084800 [Aphelenchoides fujianensis]